MGTDFREGRFKEVRIEDCVLPFADFGGNRWESVLWQASGLQDSYLEMCRFQGVEFRKLLLDRADLFRTPLKGMDLRENEIQGLVLSEKKELSGAITDRYQAAERARLLGIVIR